MDVSPVQRTRMQAVNYRLAAIAVVLLAAAAGWALYSQQSPDRQGGELDMLLSAAGQWTKADSRTAAAKYGQAYESYDGKATFATIGRRVSRLLGLPDSNAVVRDDGHPVYEAEAAEAQGIKLTATLIGMGDERQGQAYLWVSIHGPAADPSASPKMRELLRQTDGKLREAGLKPEWRYSVQGELNLEHRLNGTGRKAANRLNELVQNRFAAQPAETYADGNTISFSYYSPRFQHTIQVGNHSINLQAAVHFESSSPTQRLTLATPIISSEY